MGEPHAMACKYKPQKCTHVPRADEAVACMAPIRRASYLVERTTRESSRILSSRLHALYCAHERFSAILVTIETIDRSLVPIS
jgi:hypothetical protein